jgi:hypothetical protein
VGCAFAPYASSALRSQGSENCSSFASEGSVARHIWSSEFEKFWPRSETQAIYSAIGVVKYLVFRFVRLKPTRSALKRTASVSDCLVNDEGARMQIGDVSINQSYAVVIAKVDQSIMAIIRRSEQILRLVGLRIS